MACFENDKKLSVAAILNVLGMAGDKSRSRLVGTRLC